ncbi:MAG: MarR family transcriptional regulator [bacterium]|nr:MarR family transcriptional regulator [bacterium]
MSAPTDDSTLPRETFRNLIRVQERLTGEFALLFREYGISPTQYNVMRILQNAPSEGAPCQYIGSHLLTKVPDVTRLIDRMVASDLVRRERSERDRRIVKVHLTGKGKDIYLRLEAPVDDLHKSQLAGLSREQMQTLNHALLQVLTGSDVRSSEELVPSGPKEN